MTLINVNGTELFYTKSGQGDPLLLLHGNGEDHHIFDQLSQKLEKDFAVYAIDSRNHGESARTEQYDYEQMADDIIDFIDVLKLEKVNIVGFSDGAILAILMGIKKLSWLNKLALLGANTSPEQLKPEIFDHIVEKYKETQDPLFKLMMEQPNIPLQELRKIEVPTLIIAADDDLCELEIFEQMHQLIEASDLKIMENQDHGSYIIDNDILAESLLDFFSA
ncbi:alpha/beta fold hydrolase [Enterococcus wangshanyuanii]|uniref:Alpha/beta hydrolase n=1 Tax=Enterococcus wangshanyuanii TaxID=2005703 RepID=A0ABQ1NGN0_9ENTE|nr:alpha/beta hydrolase [Enterococcus wangshanyuanii]GGC76608.1 alpha/beta hydrolase [Enterococcus wangshanyuanii]